MSGKLYWDFSVNPSFIDAYREFGDVAFRWVDTILWIEGRKSTNRDSDAGGYTQFGITEDTLRAWMDLEDEVDTPEIDDWDAAVLYLTKLWGPTVNELMVAPSLIEFVHCDAMVNHNPLDANKVLQRSIGAKDDGIIGPKTRASLSDLAADYEKSTDVMYSWWELYREARVELYFDIFKERPSDKANIEGWMNRLFKVMEAASKIDLY